MNEEFNNQNHDEENIEVEQDNELEHRHTEEPKKTIHYKEYLES